MDAEYAVKSYIEENTSNVFEENSECLMKDDDVPCGQIFFSETTLAIKFVCSFCKKPYNDINYFCVHLSDHIKSIDFKDEINDCDLSVEPILKENILNYDHCESSEVMQAINEAEEIAAEVEEELRQERAFQEHGFDDDKSISLDEFNNVKKDLINYTDINRDFEDEIPKCPVEIVKKKGKVTTVKVIAVKNKVAELYDEILLKLNTNIKNEDESILNCYSINDTFLENKGDTKNLKDITQTFITPVTNEPKHTCPACDQSFSTPFGLTIHKRIHYLESKNQLKLAHKCSDCDQLFNKISELKQHIQEMHYPEGFLCKICGRKLSSLILLESHMRKVHLDRPFACTICKKSFGSREELELHCESHFDLKKLKCHICGRKYTSKQLIQHLERHKERKPDSCVVCGKKTLRLTQHMKTHTPRPNRILSCPICKKTFNFSSGLSLHYKNAHKLSGRIVKTLFDQRNLKNSKPSNESDAKSKGENDIKLTDFNQKEEEAKNVIVELIENSSYNYNSENYIDDSEMLNGPPIAREEIISAINSISSDN